MSATTDLIAGHRSAVFRGEKLNFDDYVDLVTEREQAAQRLLDEKEAKRADRAAHAKHYVATMEPTPAELLAIADQFLAQVHLVMGRDSESANCMSIAYDAMRDDLDAMGLEGVAP